MKNHCTASFRSGGRLYSMPSAAVKHFPGLWTGPQESSSVPVLFRSGVCFHHGFAGSPAMNRTAATISSSIEDRGTPPFPPFYLGMARVARKQGKFLCGTIRDARIVAAGKKAEVTDETTLRRCVRSCWLALGGFGVGSSRTDLADPQDQRPQQDRREQGDGQTRQFRRPLRPEPGLHGERNANVRSQVGGSWGTMLRCGTIAITGFGYFAERAEVDGFTCYNTSLSGKGDKYPDPESKVLASENSYILLTFTKNPLKMAVEIKNLKGQVLDRKEFRVTP